MNMYEFPISDIKIVKMNIVFTNISNLFKDAGNELSNRSARFNSF